MCLAIPGRVVEIKDDAAIVDYSGERRKAKILEKVGVGDYVMVNSGFVVQKVPEEEAIASLKAWEKCCQNSTS